MLDFMGADTALFYRVNGLTGHYSALDALMVAAATCAPLFYAFLLVGCWLAWRQR
jgi:lipopolysaccharide export LptBFGC system permease protein LptF